MPVRRSACYFCTLHQQAAASMITKMGGPRYVCCTSTRSCRRHMWWDPTMRHVDDNIIVWCTGERETLHALDYPRTSDRQKCTLRSFITSMRIVFCKRTYPTYSILALGKFIGIVRSCATTCAVTRQMAVGRDPTVYHVAHDTISRIWSTPPTGKARMRCPRLAGVVRLSRRRRPSQLSLHARIRRLYCPQRAQAARPVVLGGLSPGAGQVVQNLHR